MSGKKRAALVAALSILTLASCELDLEEPGRRAPTVETRVRTPKGAVRARAALSAHTPKPGAVAADSSRAEPTPAAVERAEPAPEPTPMRLVRRAIASRGVELAEAPGGRVLGDFQGRTDVEVLEDRDGWSRVRTQIIDGGTIEGWVETARLGDSKREGAKPSGDANAPAAAGGAKAPAAKAAPAKKLAGNGPDDVNLVPITGTEKKRPSTPFTHKAHWQDYSIKCETCHHPVKARGGAVPSYTCSSSGCHAANECNNATVAKKNKACPSFEDAYHTQCIDCHKQDGGPTKCAECHSG